MKRLFRVILSIAVLTTLCSCVGKKQVSVPADALVPAEPEDSNVEYVIGDAETGKEQQVESTEELEETPDAQAEDPELEVPTEDPGKLLFSDGHESIRYGSVTVQVPMNMGEFLDAHADIGYFLYNYQDEHDEDGFPVQVEIGDSFSLAPGDSELLSMRVNPGENSTGECEDFELSIWVENLSSESTQTLRELTVTSLEVHASDSYDIEYRGVRLLDGDPEPDEFYSALGTKESDWEITYGGYELTNNMMDSVEFSWSPNARWTRSIKLSYNAFYHVNNPALS